MKSPCEGAIRIRARWREESEPVDIWRKVLHAEKTAYAKALRTDASEAGGKAKG